MQMPLALDPAVPHRDRLLDVDEMRTHLQRHLGGAAAAVHAARVKYRPHHSLRVVYRIDGDPLRFVTARTFPERRAATNLSACGADFIIPELGAAFWAFPRDRRLQAIEQVMNADAALRSCVAGWKTTQLVAYAPEKSVVLACLDAARTPVAFAKVFADVQSVSRICRLYQEIASSVERNDDLTIVPILTVLPAHCAVFVAPARGQRIADLPAGRRGDALHRTGRAIARIHHARIPTSLAPFDRTAFRSLHDAALLVGDLRPNLRHAALLAAADLANSRPYADKRVLLHGDLHLKNAFVDGGRVSMIDFDQAAYGSPAADIGSLLAALRNREDEHAQAFLEGYASVRPLPSPGSLAWHTAAALLTERAVRAITRLRPQILAELDRVIDEARVLACAARTER